MPPPPQLESAEKMSSSVMLEGESKEPPEKWEIFAWAVRDVMSKASGIPKSEMH